MMTRRVSPSLLAILALLASFTLGSFMAAAARAADVVVGYIEHFSRDSSSQYWLEVDGTRRPVRLLDEIPANSTISVIGEKAELVFRMADDSTITLTEKSSPYTVPGASKPAAFPRRVAQWLTDLIGQGGEKIRHRGVELSLRSGGEQTGGSLSVPLLWHSEQKMYEGERPLVIDWGGGRAPFTVMVSPSPNLDPLTVSAVVWERSGDSPNGPLYRLAAPSTMFQKGTYTMAIIDADGRSFRGGFEVIAQPDQGQAEPGAAWSELTDFLALTELAHEHGELTLEAYQQMQLFPPGFQPAEAWSEAILWR